MKKKERKELECSYFLRNRNFRCSGLWYSVINGGDKYSRFDSRDVDPFFSAFFFFSPERRIDKKQLALPGTRSSDTRAIRLSRLKIGRRPSSPSVPITIITRSSHLVAICGEESAYLASARILIDVVHRTSAFARRINNIALHNTRAMTASGCAAIETRYRTRRLHISECCQDVETML